MVECGRRQQSVLPPSAIEKTDFGKFQVKRKKSVPAFQSLRFTLRVIDADVKNIRVYKR